MKEDLEAKLVTIDKSNGGDGSKDSVKELLSEAAYSPIKSYNHDEHRWYTTFNVVVKLGGIYVDFQDYSSSGDEDALCGQGDNVAWDSAVEVFPKEVTVTDYVTADEL